MFFRCAMLAPINSAACCEKVSFCTRSSIVWRSGRNLRIVTVGLRGISGGIIMFTRDPSGNRASTNGEDSSTRRPSGAMMRSMMRRMCASSLKRASAAWITPLRS